MTATRIRAFTALAALAGMSCANAASLEWRLSTQNNFDHGRQLVLPAGFGSGEFTLELWIRPNQSLPVGPTTSDSGKLNNWSTSDLQPYSSSGWWFEGNFLLDGHNNAGSNFQNGTFTLQFYGGGRVRWLFGDGASGSLAGRVWSVGAYPADNTDSLLDGDWHHLALVRRFTGSSQSTLELWIDGTLIDTETSSARTNMATNYWNNWTGYPSGQEGWFWGAEKQAAIGSAIWEDYKGLIDELRFWSRARTTNELQTQWQAPVSGSENGLVGWYDFSEGAGTSTCSSITANQCISLFNTAANVWNAAEAPTTGGTPDTSAPTIPGDVQGNAASSTTVNLTWAASTDDVGVTGYRVMRNGGVAGNTIATSFADTGLSANTTYSYTVSAVDAAANRSAESATVQITTPPATGDTTPPSVPANLAATATSASRITLSWDASTDDIDVSGYRVLRDGVAVATATGTNFDDSGLTASTTYSYTVSAVDAAGNRSAESAVVQATTMSASSSSSSSSSSGGNSGGGGGGRIDLAMLLMALAIMLRRLRPRFSPGAADQGRSRSLTAGTPPTMA